MSGSNKECILTLCEVQVFSAKPPGLDNYIIIVLVQFCLTYFISLFLSIWPLAKRSSSPKASKSSSIISDICESRAVAHGNFNPSDGIEGSQTTLICDEDFKTQGSWVMTCRNGSWTMEPNETLPQCVPLITGRKSCKCFSARMIQFPTKIP